MPDQAAAEDAIRRATSYEAEQRNSKHMAAVKIQTGYGKRRERLALPRADEGTRGAGEPAEGDSHRVAAAACRTRGRGVGGAAAGGAWC
eukprot:SAG11_NODE_4486_length_1877_cov_5.098988_2_plen_89_part_00